MLLSSKVLYHLHKMELRQTPKMEGGENKNRNNKFDFHEFIHFIADQIGPSYIFYILFSNIYIYIYIYTYIHI